MDILKSKYSDEYKYFKKYLDNLELQDRVIYKFEIEYFKYIHRVYKFYPISRNKENVLSLTIFNKTINFIYHGDNIKELMPVLEKLQYYFVRKMYEYRILDEQTV